MLLYYSVLYEIHEGGLEPKKGEDSVTMDLALPEACVLNPLEKVIFAI